ncbi:hypothetical protein Ancab_018586 [Ancistrocladus abbreviatus]
MAAEGSKSSSSPDSYIGSLISLTSKSEIRYEGVLYSINTEESSIGLRNVRSFGTEGRKKDGTQVPPSDKVYEYILFRGSDIKDLQVKASPPVQATTSSIDNDPAIIQSHFPRPATTSTSFPPTVSASSSDVNSQVPPLGLPGSNFQGGLPMYQPSGNLGSWGPSPPPPSANGGGLPMPMYWHGFYGPPNGLPHLHQQSLLRPPPGLSIPPSLQQPVQYPTFNPHLATGASNLPEMLPPLLTNSSNSTILSSTSLPPSSLPPVPSTSIASETLSSSVLNKAPNSVIPSMTSSVTLSSLSPLTISAPEASTISPAVSSKPNAVPGLTMLFQTMPKTSSIVSSSTPSQIETITPPLVTPDQLLQSGPTHTSAQASQISHKDVEVVQVSSTSDPSVPILKEAQPPILPLPPASRAFHKSNGPTFQGRHAYRGQVRGRGNGTSRAVTRFTEDFDFSAMNEKFKKDEVWGHLGKSSKSLTKGRDGDVDDGELEGSEDEDGTELPRIEIKPVYNKDDFFDTLSSNAIDHDSQNGRTRFSEQLKIDTETFGDFARYRGRGGRGYFRGRGGRGRGPNNYGRGYGHPGRGYGHPGRGRGRALPSRAS